MGSNFARPETRRLLSEKLSLSSDQAFETPDIDFPSVMPVFTKPVDLFVGGSCIMPLALKRVTEKVQANKWQKTMNFLGLPTLL